MDHYPITKLTKHIFRYWRAQDVSCKLTTGLLSIDTRGALKYLHQRRNQNFSGEYCCSTEVAAYLSTRLQHVWAQETAHLHNSLWSCNLQHLPTPLGPIREGEMHNLRIPGELQQIKTILEPVVAKWFSANNKHLKLQSILMLHTLYVKAMSMIFNGDS